MEAVHRYEGTVNQVMGDGIMAIFGAPLAHEDHALRACYAALRMQESIQRYSVETRRRSGTPVSIRVGLNSGEVVVRSIGSDLRMDYSAVGQTTHLAARMEQAALPGSIVITPATFLLVQGYVDVRPLGPMPVKGVNGEIEVFEITGAGPVRRRLQALAARVLSRFVGRDDELERASPAPLSKPRRAVASWSQLSASQASENRGSSSSSRTGTGPAGLCSRAAPSPTDGRRHTYRWWTYSRRISKSAIVTTSATSARKSPESSSRWIAPSSRPFPPSSRSSRSELTTPSGTRVTRVSAGSGRSTP